MKWLIRSLAVGQVLCSLVLVLCGQWGLGVLGLCNLVWLLDD